MICIEIASWSHKFRHKNITHCALNTASKEQNKMAVSEQQYRKQKATTTQSVDRYRNLRNGLDIATETIPKYNTKYECAHKRGKEILSIEIIWMYEEKNI